LDGQGSWAVWNVHILHDEWFETFAKSRSRFKIERISVKRKVGFLLFMKRLEKRFFKALAIKINPIIIYIDG
jgi:hypothetical protein